jgi:hypothetical protein
VIFYFLFWGSNLAPMKFDDKRGTTTYLQATFAHIEKTKTHGTWQIVIIMGTQLQNR